MADNRYGESYSRGRDGGGRYEQNDRDHRGQDDHRGMFNLGGPGRRGADDDRDEDWRGRERGSRAEFGGRNRHEQDSQRGRGGSDRGYGSDDHNRGLPMDETSHLIASNKVEGTAVYGGDGRRLGSIHNFMVDKLTGRVEYAVMSYGAGFLGMGTRYYPLPWRVLSYDKRAGGYRIELTERDLRTAPSFESDSAPNFDHRYGSRVHDYYGLKY